MTELTRETMRCFAEIDLGAMVHNFQVAKELSGRKVMAVIKGDAHGHGAVKCGRALEAHGCDAFAVACLASSSVKPSGTLQGYPNMRMVCKPARVLALNT